MVLLILDTKSKLLFYQSIVRKRKCRDKCHSFALLSVIKLITIPWICSWRGAVIEPDQSTEPPSSKIKEPEKPSSVEAEDQKEPGK